MDSLIESKILELKKASIIELDQNDNKVQSIPCMFNPFEYTVSKENSFKEQASANGKNSPRADLSQAGAQKLSLVLVFDTYEKSSDVRTFTDKLWKLMAVKPQQNGDPNAKEPPPLVAFQWGSFYFRAYITSMQQKFTLFTKDGTPVRATVNVTFTQYVDVDDYDPQNPTSGGGPVDRTWQIIASDRLDTIAADVYRDATKWRLIAERNGITDPLSVEPGQHLMIPFDS